MNTGLDKSDHWSYAHSQYKDFELSHIDFTSIRTYTPGQLINTNSIVKHINDHIAIYNKSFTNSIDSLLKNNFYPRIPTQDDVYFSYYTKNKISLPAQAKSP